MKVTQLIFCQFVLFCVASVIFAETRSSISLNGQWSRVIEKTTKQSDEGWAPVTIPAIVDIGNFEPRCSVRFKRQISIPAEWNEKRIIVEMRGARFNPKVYVDGKLIGGYDGGWWPGEVEITSAVSPGKSYSLEISCDDWQSQIADGYVHPKDGKKEDLQGRVIAPVGGYKTNIGLWDDVNLKAVPANRINDSSIKTSTYLKDSQFKVSGTIDSNKYGLSIKAIVMDSDNSVVELKELAVNKDNAFELSGTLDGLKVWSPESPKLYQLKVILMDKDSHQVYDETTIRIGFREVTTSGSDFYLNGIKRHMLAGSYWPPHQPKTKEEIRAEMIKVKASGCNTFRLHIGGWQEEWINAADEIGLMIVDEIPAYTDGDGMYAYTRDEFWQNYRHCIDGMVSRDHNHPSLVLWSLGNEILFMGNKKYDDDLPAKLGKLATYTKSIDPDHPVTFEADLDPDNQFDVIGLHYPHEMPQNYAYPNTGDWLSKELQTEAGGGMLGKASNKFYWDRKKPLYIGEYLWVPMGDYSAGTIYFGDDAYLDRESFLSAAKRLAWSDQTLAYRRQNVTGMCPWGATGDKKEYFLPIAAYLRNRSLRYYNGDDANLIFDVFNDSDKSQNLKLNVKCDEYETANQEFDLGAGEYKEVKVSIKYISKYQNKSFNLSAVLSDAAGHVYHQKAYPIKYYSRSNVTSSPTVKLIAFDPSGAWPESSQTLDVLQNCDPRSTILLVAPNGLGETRKSGPTLIGDQTFESQKFVHFVRSGGRAIILEQKRLSPLGLDLSLVEHASTMTFKLNETHPILKGVADDDLKYWGNDNFVTDLEIRRAEKGGAKSVTVSGGPNSLDQSPIVEMPLGEGHIVFLQALIGKKLNVEPVTQVILQNAVNYLAGLPPRRKMTSLMLVEDKLLINAVKAISADVVFKESYTQSEIESADSLILQGSNSLVTKYKDSIKSFLKGNGRTLYWADPSPESFNALRDEVGTEAISIMDSSAQAVINDKAHDLLRGVSREDLTFTTAPVSWTRNISLQPAASGYFVTAPQSNTSPINLANQNWKSSNGALISEKQITFTHRSSISSNVTISTPGRYLVKASIKAIEKLEHDAQFNLKVNGITQAGFRVASNDSKDCDAYLVLPSGEVQLEVQLANLSEWGDTPLLSVSNVSLIPYVAYPDAISSPLTSGALIEIKNGKNRIVIDKVNWFKNDVNRIHGYRYASALFDNLGILFRPPEDSYSGDTIPNAAFTLVGESKYFSNDTDQIAFRNNGKIVADFEAAMDGNYVVSIRGFSSPVRNIYAKVLIEIDNLPVGEIDMDSKASKEFELPKFKLSKGGHAISISFTNDELSNNEDRNAFIDAVRIGLRN